MDDKRGRFAAATGKNPALADKLDDILTGPNDRAFLVCTCKDCTNNAEGECLIYTVHDVPKMRPGVPCGSNDSASHFGGEKGDEASN